MTLEQVQDFITRQPFRAFTINTGDGKSFRVTSPEFIMRFPNGRALAIATPESRLVVIDIQLITSIEDSGAEGQAA